MQLDHNERGFSLVEIAITLGISGLFTVMFMRYSLNSYNQDSHMNYLAQVNETLTTLQYSLSKPETCNKVFNGLIVPTDTSGNDVEELKISADQILIKKGKYQAFDVSDMKIFRSAISNSSAFDLEVSFRPLDKYGFNAYFAPATSLIRKRITVIGTKDAMGKIRSCGPIVSDVNQMAKEQFCVHMADMGKTVTVGTEKKCEFTNAKQTCVAPMVPSKLTNKGGLECIHIANRIGLEKVFDFEMRKCDSKNYTLYQDPTSRLVTVGCSATIPKETDLPLP